MENKKVELSMNDDLTGKFLSSGIKTVIELGFFIFILTALISIIAVTTMEKAHWGLIVGWIIMSMFWSVAFMVVWRKLS